ncbi:MAG TPA: 4-(cytidine 5'-diphospho)-2-C-methyl-D-erythritol kinase [Rhodanobacteraceae bacterium]|nr:4-(cytidine 5'-diphospho)-2-C-methyl-D-erythritol kinase [Rhodanobacteraceae bacterium]
MIKPNSWSTWPAPAKLNLFLRIVGLRADGYHLLQTVFRLLDWGDEIRLRVRDDGAIVRVAGANVIGADDDLAVRAAHALRHATGTRLGADIVVEKKIPIGAGLGGGSSDAASVLLALNELWHTRCSREQLAGLGLMLGADVPVFVRGHSAWAEGIGEKLTQMELPRCWYVMLDAGIHVSTGALFQAPELTRNAVPATIPGFVSGIIRDNAFEPVVRARCPQVAVALDWLGQFGAARLSGTGGAVFLEVETEREARAIAEKCPREFIAWVARGVDVSPLEEALTRSRSREGAPLDCRLRGNDC